MIGTWICRQRMQSSLGGPSVTKLIATRSGPSPGDILLRVLGTGFDAAGYLHYDAKTQTWWNPVSLASGGGTESSRQTGRSTVWNGTFTDGSGTVNIRDTYVQPTMRMYSDTTQIQRGGSWKTVGRSTCVKS